MRRLAIVPALLVLAACSQPSIADRLVAGQWVDLTYDFDSTTIYWPTAQPFHLTVVSAQRTPGGWYYAANNFAAAVPELHFPGLSLDAARELARRRVGAVGIDTPSIDYGQTKNYGVHRRLFAANIPAFENVAHMEELPLTGAFVIALPMKITGGSGGPLRIVALLP